MEDFTKLVKQFEGCRLEAYLCPAGIWTCGWGSTGPGIEEGVVWSQEQADERLEKDLVHYYEGVKRLCPGLESPRLDAVADLAYNIGLGALEKSTLRRKVNAGEHEAVVEEFRRWVIGGGRRLPGLVRRREAEIALYLLGG